MQRKPCLDVTKTMSTGSPSPLTLYDIYSQNLTSNTRFMFVDPVTFVNFLFTFVTNCSDFWYKINPRPAKHKVVKSTCIRFDTDIDIYLTAIGLAPGGGITRHIYNQTIPNLHREKNLGNAGRALSLLSVIPWHLPNNWGKSTEKTSVRVAQYQNPFIIYI